MTRAPLTPDPLVMLLLQSFRALATMLEGPSLTPGATIAFPRARRAGSPAATSGGQDAPGATKRAAPCDGGASSPDRGGAAIGAHPDEDPMNRDRAQLAQLNLGRATQDPPPGWRGNLPLCRGPGGIRARRDRYVRRGRQ